MALDKIDKQFFLGYGFGLPYEMEGFKVKYSFGIPMSAPVEKGVLILNNLPQNNPDNGGWEKYPDVSSYDVFNLR